MMMMISVLTALTSLPSALAIGSVLQNYLYLSTSPSPIPPLGPSRIPQRDEMDDYYHGITSNQTLLQEIGMDRTSLSSNLIGNDSGYPSTASTSDLGNRSLKELMEEEMSEYPLSDPLSIAVPMTCIYILILLSGLVGNISTCVVIARTSYMHTATNYYLFSLAMSDLLLLISGLPQEMYHIWIKYPYVFGEAFCVIRGLAAETSSNATVLTITAFTVERFVAIVYPLKSHKLSQLSRVVRMIGIIWIVAFCLALPQAAQFGVKDHTSRYDPDSVLIKGAWCTLVREIFPYAFQISICVFFAIPMTIITVLYVLIGLKLRRSRKGPMTRNSSQELSVEPRTQNRHSQSHVVRMLVAVVLAFFICWLPFHTQRLMALYGKSQTETPSDLFMIIYQGVTHVSGILYYISTCINPILYHIMSNKFRQAFKDTMGQLCGRQSSRLHNRTYSAISHRSMRTGVLHYTSQRNNRQRDHLAGDIPQCLNCRGITPTCSCRRVNMINSKSTTNNSSKFLRANFAGVGMNGGDGNNAIGNGNCTNENNTGNTITLLNSSPSEKDGMIAMATLDKSQGPVSQADKPQQPSGLRALLCRKKDSNKIPKKRSGGFLMRRPHRHPSDPEIPSTYAVAVLDSKGNSKSIPVGILRRPRTGSSGNAVSIVGIHKNTCRATSYTSVDSGKSNNTISNSSLQDMDESEYTGEELAGYMAELNHNLESPVKKC